MLKPIEMGCSLFLLLACVACPTRGEHPYAAREITSLTNSSVRYESADLHYVVLQRGDVTAIIVDNEAVDVPELPGHRAGYNGVASLKHKKRNENLCVPSVGGLNFEHIHDGTTKGLVEKFEPRKFPMQLRIIDQHTVELYQPPTANWKLESCGRYRLLSDGCIEYTFECIPRADGYRNGYIGLFWASYIHQPEDKAIHFKGRLANSNADLAWIKGVTPSHGVDSTHPPAQFRRTIKVDDDFPLTLVNHPSKYVHSDAWYFGVSHGLAFSLMFQPNRDIWLAQSPSGGGSGNPAWDFQWFIPDYKVGEAYGFTMRAAYIPFETREQVQRETQTHRDALRSR